MKAKKASKATKLIHIPNIGKAFDVDLKALGITRPDQLKGKHGIALYKKLNKQSGKVHDPCVADVFIAAIDFMNGGEPKPWWKFTEERKKLLK